MKKNILLPIIIFIASLSSCICIDSDKDDFDDEKGFISLTIKTPSNNGTIESGEKLEIKIIANDDDGIDKVFLQIPNINVDKIYTTTGDDIEIHDIFIIQDEDTQGNADIIVKIKDKDGNITRKSGDIDIQ